MPGELLNSPAEVLRHAFISMGLGSTPDEKPWPIFVDTKADVECGSDNIVIINNTTGRGFGFTQFDGERMEHEGIQVRTRSTVPELGYRVLRGLALVLDKQMHQQVVSMDGGDYLIEDIIRSSDVLFAGPVSKDDKRPTHSVNATMDITMLSFDSSYLQVPTDWDDIIVDSVVTDVIGDTDVLFGNFEFTEGEGNVIYGTLSTTLIDESGTGSGTG